MTSPASVQEQTLAATQAQAAALAAQSEQASAMTQAYLLSQARDDTWYDTDAITRISRELARLTDSYAVSAARSTDRFTADLVRLMNLREGLSTGGSIYKTFRPVGVRDTIGLAGENGSREGVTTAGLFGRAADTYRYQQSLNDQAFLDDVAAHAETPTELVTPTQAAVTRAQRAAQQNVALAMRNQSAATLAEAQKQGLVTGYRRVLHPELAREGGDCGLCIAASPRIYRSGTLMPMHPGCHCVPVPVNGKHDPGLAINDADISQIYSDAAGHTSAADLRATRYKVDDHSETGPVLRPFGAPIRAKHEAEAARNKTRTKSEAAKLRTLTAKRDRLAKAYGRVTSEDDAWRVRLAAVADRIEQLNRDIAAAGG